MQLIGNKMAAKRLALTLANSQMEYLERTKRETGRSMNDIVRVLIQQQIEKEADRKAG